MCDAKPGLRCWADTSKRSTSLETKAENVDASIKEVRNELSAAAKNSDFSQYSKLKRRESALKQRSEKMRTAIRHNQRDMDSTKTGQKQLDELIANAEDDHELESYMIRKKTSMALRFQRSTAVEELNASQKPLLRVA